MNRDQLKNELWENANRHLSTIYLDFVAIGGQIPLPSVFSDNLMKKTDEVISEYIEYIIEQKKGVKND